jgi:hypothetical protein
MAPYPQEHALWNHGNAWPGRVVLAHREVTFVAYVGLVIAHAARAVDA